MSSPNEPGYPRTGEAPGSANGSGGGPSSTENGSPGNPSPRGGNDVPPWQRGPAGARRQPQRQAPEGGHNAGVDARLNRFIAGGSGAPAHDQDGAPFGERTETVRPETYASELPDLSGPAPRQAQPRKATSEQRPAAEPASRPSASGRTQVGNRHKGPVRASMQIRRIDPWSTLKVSLVLSVALFFVWMIAVAFLYLVLGGMGVWSKLNSNVGDLLTSAGGSTGGELVSSGTIFGGAALIGLVNIVLLTAMATCAAFIYNLTTDLVGGVEVTLADRD
ncbi:DUF3566 domain-containing protein [Mycobacterium sp. NPDC048908]|uniref:DUF3566 domain-containing protein n=1 Tax=Mycobacterium sp. NPDC048908 TaxID=3364292 RepID=UPI003718316D